MPPEVRPARPRQKKSSRGRRRGKEDNRRRALLDAAARLFSVKGFAGTSIRDIAAEVGMLPGSMYYHFASKEDLLLAVHEEGVAHIKSAVQAAVATAGADPWDRLEAACVAHLEALLGGGDYTQVVTPEFPRAFPEPLRSQMIAQRDSYEKLFAGLVARIDLPRGISRRYLRLALLGALNWTLTWYHPGGNTPATIARRMIALFRRQLDTGD